MRRLFTQSRFTQSKTGIRRQGAKAMNSPLKWEVFISPQVAVITSDLPPGATERKWSPISSTLISGERDAVLVDTFITMEQNRELAEWVVASGKNLTTIYATHGHGDHFFGVNTIKQRFPNELHCHPLLKAFSAATKAARLQMDLQRRSVDQKVKGVYDPAEPKLIRASAIRRTSAVCWFAATISGCGQEPFES